MTEHEQRADLEDVEGPRPGSAGSADERRGESGGERRDDRNADDFSAAFDRERLRLGSTSDAVLAALLEGGPEAVEHLLKAAQELLLAAKAVVDAGERAVESHRAVTDAGADTGEPPDRARMRRIDLA